VNIRPVNALSCQTVRSSQLRSREGRSHRHYKVPDAQRRVTGNSIRGTRDNIPKSLAGGVLLGRLATLDEIARVVAFLVADDTAFITGTTLSISG